VTETGFYVYAVSRHLDPASVSPLRGLQDAPLRVIAHAGLSAVVSEVHLDEFGDEGLRRNLENLAWLEQVARTHDAVVHAVGETTTSAPLRLATICLDEERVKHLLDEWHDLLVRALERIEGRQEWSVKVVVPPSPVAEAEPEDSLTTLPVGAGAAYLKRRKEESERKRESAAHFDALAAEIHALLSSAAAASRRLAPQDPRLSGHQGVMSLNAAYLVDESEVERFSALVRDLQDGNPSVRLDVQGPWPPYSFATLDDE